MSSGARLEIRVGNSILYSIDVRALLLNDSVFQFMPEGGALARLNEAQLTASLTYGDQTATCPAGRMCDFGRPGDEAGR